ncbi:TPA: NgoPII family restriction endonuclease [Candidatus Nomurabacteria bacterium]|nr:MAG: hypothetical protein O210_OD1C00001G0290 [Parcubacteria bacterium RAAC4_OD1_1]HCY26469.1 NgoPII family restriction endonuclease [Candidatus Nomurabacteria bacterium]
METNLLKAIRNIIANPSNDLLSQYRSLNRMNSMGEALEFYVKDIFCDSLKEDNSDKGKIYSEYFSYLGNQNNPPDIIIKNGDAIEVKKHIGARASGLALNSSYPKDYLYADSPMITTACRGCENWEKKDLLYVIGSIVDSKIKSLWFVYGDCYAASREIYEKIKDAISDGVNSLPDIEFGETNELGRVNKVDPLGITDLRIRGMWAIKHPNKVFDYISEISNEADFKVNAIMLSSKYNSFPESDRKELESLISHNLIINDIKIKSPNNPAKYLNAKLIRFSK